MASTKFLKLKQNWCLICFKDKKKNPEEEKEKMVKGRTIGEHHPCWRIWTYVYKDLELEENFRWLYEF